MYVLMVIQALLTDWTLHASLESRVNEAETPVIHFHECLNSVRYVHV